MLFCWLDTPQRQSDVLRMAPGDVEDGGINVVQQKTGRVVAPSRRSGGCAGGLELLPFVQTPKGEAYNTDRSQAAWRPAAEMAGRLHLPRAPRVERRETA